MANSIDFDAIQNTATANLDLEGKVAVPKAKLAEFATTRGFGKAVKRTFGGQYVVRTIEGTVYLVPVQK